MFARTRHCIFSWASWTHWYPLACFMFWPSPPSQFITLIVFDVESVIDQVPHSENSSPFLTFSLRSKLCTISCFHLQYKRRRSVTDYKEMAVSVNNHSRCNRNSRKLMIITIMMSKYWVDGDLDIRVNTNMTLYEYSGGSGDGDGVNCLHIAFLWD